MSKEIKVTLLGDRESELLLRGDIGEVEGRVVERFFDLLSQAPTEEKNNNKVPLKEKKRNKKSEVKKEAVQQVVPVDPESLTLLSKHFNEGGHLKSDDSLENEDDLLDPEKNKHHVRLLEDGTKLFSTEYACPVCGNAGKRFSHISNLFAKCHECGTKIRMAPATNQTLKTKEFGAVIPKPNDDGYFFEAYDLFE